MVDELIPGSRWSYDGVSWLQVVRYFQISKTPGMFLEMVDEDGVIHRHDLMMVEAAINQGDFIKEVRVG